MDQRTPNLFIIGAPKAGTTFVHHALGLADPVFMSPVKEPGFFTSPRDYRRGLGYYLDAYFARAAGSAVRGESTPWYLYSTDAIGRIAALPAVAPPRFIVLVRRPSDRAFSMYRDQVRTKRETRSFEDAVEEELAGLAAGSLRPDIRQRYVWCGRYAEHIERWQEAFGHEQVHISLFDDLHARPEQVWAELATFLDVSLGPSRFDHVSERDRNPSGSLRWPRLDMLIRSLEGRDNPALERVKRVLPPGLHRRILQRIGRINRTPEPADGVDAGLDDATRRRVDDACLDDTGRLEKLIGRTLPEWSGQASDADRSGDREIPDHPDGTTEWSGGGADPAEPPGS